MRDLDPAGMDVARFVFEAMPHWSPPHILDFCAELRDAGHPAWQWIRPAMVRFATKPPRQWVDYTQAIEKLLGIS